MVSPKVSVLVATYNRPQFVGKAIEGALRQTFCDFEIVVVDDGTDDRTRAAVATAARGDERVKYIRRGKPSGIAAASNFGLQQARGEYVAILDDDDWWLDAQKLEKQVAFLSGHLDYVGCGGGIVVVDREGKEKLCVSKPQEDKTIRSRALYANPMANSTTMFRRAVAEEVGRYDETLRQFADWDFWLKMGMKGKLYNFPERFTAYRMWDEGASFAKQRENAAAARRIVHRYRSKYPHYFRALILAHLYSFYACFPTWLKRFINAPLSRLKKTVFSN